jgi:hypothetical protein
MTHTDPPSRKVSAGQPPPPRTSSDYDDGVVHHPRYDSDGYDDLHNEDVAHEHTDVNIRAILMFAAGLVVVAVVVHILMWAMFRWLDDSAKANDPQLSPLVERAPAMPETTVGSPEFGHARGGAQLLTNEPMALEKLRSEETKKLEAYGWVDGKPGVAHMPIGAAKKLILERGVPVRAGDPIDPMLGTRGAAMGEASGGRTIPTGKTTAQPAPAAPQQPGQQPPATTHGSHRPSGGKH